MFNIGEIQSYICVDMVHFGGMQNRPRAAQGVHDGVSIEQLSTVLPAHLPHTKLCYNQILHECVLLLFNIYFSASSSSVWACQLV